jgi:hypothetical protein
MIYDFWESDSYEADYWQGVLVITDKATRKCGSVSLTNDKGHNITKRQWDSSLKTHSVERALNTWARLVTDWQG